jgi:hypothetical protein
VAHVITDLKRRVARALPKSWDIMPFSLYFSFLHSLYLSLHFDYEHG